MADLVANRVLPAHQLNRPVIRARAVRPGADLPCGVAGGKLRDGTRKPADGTRRPVFSVQLCRWTAPCGYGIVDPFGRVKSLAGTFPE